MSRSKFRSWKCGLCGEPVIEGQRMVVLGKLGYVHIECFYEYLKDKFTSGIPRDILALSDANEALAYAIVRMKQAERLGVERDLLESVRHKLEDLAGEIDLRLSSKLVLGGSKGG